MVGRVKKDEAWVCASDACVKTVSMASSSELGVAFIRLLFGLRADISVVGRQETS